jgi:hypothetical protein
MRNNHQDIHPEATRQVSAREISTSSPSSRASASREEIHRPSLDHALVQIEAIKTGFREAISGLTKLGDIIRATLREQKASDKDLQQVRQTLRSLQGVRI